MPRGPSGSSDKKKDHPVVTVVTVATLPPAGTEQKKRLRPMVVEGEGDIPSKGAGRGF